MTPRENAQHLFRLIPQGKAGTVGRLLLYAVAYAVRRSTGWELYRGGIFSFRFGRFEVMAGRGDLGTISEIFVNRAYQVPGFIPSDGDICVDIGANIGCVSLQWRLTNPSGRILAVEPHPGTVEVLRRNCALNPGVGVTVVHAAAGSQNGEVELVIDRNQNSMARTAGEHLRYFEAYAAEERIMVKCVTLDSLVLTYALPRIDVLKIDVEGFEVECLKGAPKALGLTDRMIVEFHGEDLRVECARILEEHGFAIQVRGSLMFCCRGARVT
jgi:FkbM family methyltransferase